MTLSSTQRPSYPYHIGYKRSHTTAQHCTQSSPLLSIGVQVGARVMRYNFDCSLALLMLIGSVLVVLWIVVGYGPQGLAAQSTPQQQTARAE